MMASSSDPSFEHLAQGAWPALRFLDLSVTLMCDKAVQYIVSASWPELEELNLFEGNITVVGLGKLTTGQWPRLRGLELGSNNVTKRQAVNMFQDMQYMAGCKFAGLLTSWLEDESSYCLDLDQLLGGTITAKSSRLHIM